MTKLSSKLIIPCNKLETHLLADFANMLLTKIYLLTGIPTTSVTITEISERAKFM